MGKLYKYQPTLGMSKDDRTQANYTAKILEWLHSVENLLTTVADITYTETGCTLTPKFANINGKVIAIEVNSSGSYVVSTKTGNQSPAWASSSVSLSGDPYLYIISDADMVGLGLGTTPFCCSIHSATKFDGTECGVEVTADTYNLVWFTGNGVQNGTSQYYGTEAVGTTSSYCMKPFTFAVSGVIQNHVMSADGGMEKPVRGSVFTIGDDTYVGMVGNFVMKV